MRDLEWAWVGYIGACLILPFVWGVMVHWIFSRLPQRQTTPRAPARREETAPAVWDYHI